MKRQNAGSSCASPGSQQISAPKSNIWGGLTDFEAASITVWLHNQQSLNLTANSQAGDWDNTIILVEQMMPNKTDALAYIDNNAAVPERYARVVLQNAATEEPYFEELLVGPLPVGNGNTRIEPLAYPYTKKSSGRIRSQQAIIDGNDHTAWVYGVTSSIADITQELWGGTITGTRRDIAQARLVDPTTQDDGIIHWYQFFGYPIGVFDDDTLQPLGLYFSGNITGRDPSAWTFEGWYYNGVYYENTDEFRKAFFSPGFEKLKPNVGGPWSATDMRGRSPALDNEAPPAAFAPGGSRYFVDEKEKYVKWMDFEFYIAFTHDTGVRIFDIKYKGQRIIYELGLEEAMAHYAGNDPFQSGSTYLDSSIGLGSFSFEMVPGYDCPTYATYLDTSYYSKEKTHLHRSSICFFEALADFPIQRHSGPDSVSVTKNVYFTMRNVCTAGNYDYMFSYSFYMDGSIHVEVRASGYILAAYWANNEDYGFTIHDSLSGSMHDHVLNFKLDMDVLGTANTLATTSFVPTTEVYPWSKGRPRNTMKVARDKITNEDQGKLMWTSNDATSYAVVNSDALNPYGNPRGYRITPSSSTIHLTVENSTNLANAANWATHDFFVTKQKDTEPRAAHSYNNQDVHDPMIDFDQFFDGENLEQEDLVIWFNLGMHHIPHTGDLPNTVFTTAHSGLKIVPMNYLPGDPSRATQNQVRIDYHRGNTTNVEIFGQASPGCSPNLGVLTPNLYDYSGDVIVSKYPFDPDHPGLGHGG